MDNKTETVAVDKIWIFRISTLVPVFAFAIPFLLSGPQLITGTIVNTLLYIASAKKFSRNSLYVTAMLPSLGAVSNGILFGKFTPFLLFFVPSIWIGNMVLISTFNKLKNTYSFPINIVVPSILKTIVLYSSALVFTSIHLVPKIFLTSMGIFQLMTAIFGGFLSIILFKISKSKI